MNQKEFEIFAKWRKEKYEIDLEKLRDASISQGSSIIEKKALWLKKEYNAEIGRKKALMEDYENEKEKRDLEGKNMIKTNRFLVIIAIISLFISLIGVGVGVYFSIRSNSIGEKQLLPQFEVVRIINGLNTSKASESVNIKNKGALCYDSAFSIISFLRVDVTQNSTEAFRIPLENYFAWEGLIDDRNDSATFSYNAPLIDGIPLGETKYNYSELSNLSSDFSSLAIKREGKVGFIFVEHFIKIKYQDPFGFYRSEYYALFGQSESKKINKVAWENMFKLHEQKEHFILSGEQDAKWILDYTDKKDPDFTYSN